MRKFLAGVCAVGMTLGASVAMANGSDQGAKDQTDIQGQSDYQAGQGQSGMQDQGVQGQSSDQQLGQQQVGSEQGQGLSGSQSQQYLGKVKGVDLQKHEVTITLPLAPDAKITRNGHQASLNELKQGDDVRVDFQPTSQGVKQIEAQSKDMSKQMQPSTGQP